MDEWVVVIAHTAQGERIGIDEIYSGVEPEDILSGPLSEDNAVARAEELSKELSIPLFEG